MVGTCAPRTQQRPYSKGRSLSGLRQLPDRADARGVPDAEVTGYETLIDGMTNHEKDRHVLAAAVRGNAEVLVTFNLDDFPNPR